MASQKCEPTTSGPVGRRWEIVVPLTDGTTHAASCVSTVAHDFADIRSVETAGIHVVNGITTTIAFTVEGSLNGTNFSTIAYGVGSTAAYTQSAASVAGSATAILFLPNGDALRFVRVNVSTPNANGTTFTLFGSG